MGRRRRRSQAALRSNPGLDEVEPGTEPEPEIEQEDIEETVEANPITSDKTEQEGDGDTEGPEQQSKPDNAVDISQPQEPNPEEEEKLTKEQEIWESMREEFHPGTRSHQSLSSYAGKLTFLTCQSSNSCLCTCSEHSR